MLELQLATHDDKGREKLSLWSFSPLDVELQLVRESGDGDESTGGTGITDPVYAKSAYVITIGAGALRSDKHRESLVRLLYAHKILWEHTTGTKTEWREYTPEFDRKILFEYLSDKRSLPRLKLTLVTTKARFAPKFEEFIAETISTWQRS